MPWNPTPAASAHRSGQLNRLHSRPAWISTGPLKVQYRAIRGISAIVAPLVWERPYRRTLDRVQSSSAAVLVDQRSGRRRRKTAHPPPGTGWEEGAGFYLPPVDR